MNELFNSNDTRGIFHYEASFTFVQFLARAHSYLRNLLYSHLSTLYLYTYSSMFYTLKKKVIALIFPFIIVSLMSTFLSLSSCSQAPD